MSLKTQTNKKKAAQEEMRRLMAERKKKDIKPVKIDNPLAKYNNTGQLNCILCSSVVRSDNVWQVHVNSKQHRANVEQAKKLKEVTKNFTVPKQKRLSPPKEAPPEKKIKGILKNVSGPTTKQLKPKNNVPNVITFHNEEIKRAPLNAVIVEAVKQEEVTATTSKGKKEEEKPQQPEAPIPEGFFDDPILDAKVRNIEYKDPVEEEWDKFQKEIKEEATASAEIIAGEQEEATAERQIEEIDEQMRIWSKVLDLELKKEETKKKTQEVEQMNVDEGDDSDDDADIDEYLDWRAKKSYS